MKKHLLFYTVLLFSFSSPLVAQISTTDFVTTWRTTTANESITIPRHYRETYNFDVDWNNDGIWDQTSRKDITSHTYAEPGDHTVRIKGLFPRIHLPSGGDKDKIQTVEQWGTNPWVSMRNAFFDCSNLRIPATDAPNLSNLTDMSNMFEKASSMNAASLNDWDVSNVTDMSSMFSGATAFNQPLDKWDVSNVTDMSFMFYSAINFNQPLNAWNVSNVTNMSFMFYQASSFDQPLNAWDVSNVTNISLSLSELSPENYSATLKGWSQLEGLKSGVSLHATSIYYSNCVQAERDVLTNAPNSWTINDAGSVARCLDTDLVMTFETTTANETITIPTALGETYDYEIDWDGYGQIEDPAPPNAPHTYPTPGIHTVRIRGLFPRIYFNDGGDKDKIRTVEQWGDNQWNSMDGAFAGCSNLRITATDTPNLSNVTNLSRMFSGATAFNQSLATWDISQVSTMEFMLDNTALSIDDYSATLEAWSQLTVKSNVSLGAAGLNYSSCVQPQRDVLTNTPNSWTITDAGPVVRCLDTDFVMTFETTTANETITIPTAFGETYNYEIDWDGDGLIDDSATTDAVHTFLTPGIHTVRIKGLFPRIYFNDGGDKDKIRTVEQWGDVQWNSMDSAFAGCSNLRITATDTPNLSNVTNLSRMFSGATAFNQSLATWDISQVSTMEFMLDNTALSIENYSATLEAWSQLDGLQSGLILGAAGLNYSDCVQPQRDILTSAPYNWTINDAGSVARCLDTDFVMTFETTMANETITIPTASGGIYYNYEIDWDGDGLIDDSAATDAVHTFLTPGIHTVRIRGRFPRIYFNDGGDKDKIRTVEQWGDNQWNSMDSAFAGCSNLRVNATDAPILSDLYNLSRMFSGATAFNQSLATWDISNVDDMSRMLDNTALSIENYSATLEAWSQLGVRPRVTLGAAGLNYSNCVQPQRDVLTSSAHNWIINDAGVVVICLDTDFVMTWQTTTPNETITIPTALGETYNYEIDWEGLGVFEESTTTGAHTYAEPGDHTIRIRGLFPRIYFNDGAEKNKIVSIDQWGDSQWSSMDSAFAGCSNLRSNATDAPNLSNVTNLSRMFSGATVFDQSLATWDISNVTAMDGMLDNTALSLDNYNAILNAWSKIETLQSGVTLGAAGLNYSDCVQPQRDILTSAPNNWTITDGGSVENCTTDDFVMTWRTTSPNEYITIPTILGETYNYEIDWDGDGIWDETATGTVAHQYPAAGDHTVRIKGLFPRIYFDNNGDIGKIRTVDQWGTNPWTSMRLAFAGCSNLRITATDTPNLSNATDLVRMFSSASSMNAASLKDWDVSNVTAMSYMFSGATAFNQSLDKWDVSKSTMYHMLDQTGMSIENYSLTLVAWSQLDARNRALGAAGLNYSDCVQPQRDILTSAPNNWTINDAGPVVRCLDTDFVMTFETTTANETITIPTALGETYDYEIDWDGFGVFEDSATPNAPHTYPTPGIHTVRIKGLFPRIYFNDGGDKDKIRTVEQWGDNPWSSMRLAFAGCSNLRITATDTPNLSGVTNMANMFYRARSINAASLKDWDVSNVTAMSYMFSGATAFNQSLATWDISNVTKMLGMLDYTALSIENYSATLEAWSQLTVKSNVTLWASDVYYSNCVQAERDILTSAPYNWTINDAGPVVRCLDTDFVMTFETTTADETITIPTASGETYNYEIDWDGDGLIDDSATSAAVHTFPTPGIHTVRIRGLFPRIYFTAGGDKDKIRTVEQWGTNPWTSMNLAFAGCSNLRITATDAPNLSNATNLSVMFAGAASMNAASLNDWDVSNITDMGYMFLSAYSFNQPLNAWNVSNVTKMVGLFYEATAFNQPLDKWDVSNVTSMFSMFNSAHNFNQSLNDWDVSNVTNMYRMFNSAHNFNQSLNDWDVSNVTDMSGMLDNTALSPENYSAVLEAWSQLTVKSNVSLGAAGLNYFGCNQEDRNRLVNAPNSWTITDAGSVDGCIPSYVKIGVNTATSTILGIESTKLGVLLPRMTEAQMGTITTPAEGLMVYCLDCTTKGLYIYDGTDFITLTTGN